MIGQIGQRFLAENLPHVVVREVAKAREIAEKGLLLGLPLTHAATYPGSGSANSLHVIRIALPYPWPSYYPSTHLVTEDEAAFHLWEAPVDGRVGWFPEDLERGPLTLDELLEMGEFGRLSEKAKAENRAMLQREKREIERREATMAYEAFSGVLNACHPVTADPGEAIRMRLQRMRPYGRTPSVYRTRWEVETAGRIAEWLANPVPQGLDPDFHGAWDLTLRRRSV